MEFVPPKIRILHEIRAKARDVCCSQFQSKSVDFCYFQNHFLSTVISFVLCFFWSVDMNENLQYPDFSVIVLYSKLLIGCAFMTTDIQVSEAYIPFLLVHPDFWRCGIAKVMLYHLIQSCQGKDVTLLCLWTTLSCCFISSWDWKLSDCAWIFMIIIIHVWFVLGKNAFFALFRPWFEG